MADRRYSFSHS